MQKKVHMCVCIVCIIDEGKTNKRTEAKRTHLAFWPGRRPGWLIWPMQQHFHLAPLDATTAGASHATRPYTRPLSAHLSAPVCLPACLPCLPVHMYYDYFQFGITETHFVMRQQRNVVSPPLYLSLPLSVSVAVASFPVLGATQHRGACEINLCNYVTVTAAAPGTERNRVALGEKERAGSALSDRHQFGNRSAFCHLPNSVGNQHR